MTREEFGHYVANEYDVLYRFVRSRIPNSQDAEDVLQKTLLRLLLICHSIHPLHPSGFFFTALRNAIIDYYRHRGRRPPETELPENLPEDTGSDPTLPADDNALEVCRTRLRQALAGLTPRERRAFTAYWRSRGERPEALTELGVSAAGKEERYRVYDGPLYHAKRKLSLALLPNGSGLADVGLGRLWQLVLEVLESSGPGPEGGVS